MTSLDRPRGRKRGIALLLAATLVVAGAVAASELTTSALLDPAAPVEVTASDSGTVYCPIVSGPQDTAQLEVASASVDTDSEIVITRYVDGVPAIDETRLLEAGRSAVLDIPVDQLPNPVEIDWSGGPVVAQYRVVDDTEAAVANCQSQPSDRWYLSGFDTTRGSRSLLYMFNPFSQDALVSLSFGTAEGRVDLVIAEEILVPAGRVEVRDLADFRPETEDLAVTVTGEVGRVVAQGQLVRGPAGEGLEGITGRAFMPAVAAPSEQVLIPDALVDDVTDSWVTVYNPDDRAAAVQVQVTTPLGTATTLGSEITVPAGGTTRVDLAELSALPRMGVQVSSVNGIGLVASRTSAVQDGARAGVAVEVGVPAPDVLWAVPGGRGDDATITLYNPGTEVATARVEMAGGQPEEWAAVNVPPNAVTSLPLTGLDPQGPALVQSDTPLVAGLVSLSPGQATAFFGATGISGTQLAGGGEGLPARRDPGLSSLPALSATATPTPTPVAPIPGGEGQLDPDDQPTIIPEPSVTPTPSPGVTQPAPEPGSPEPTEPAGPQATPSPTAAPGSSPGPSPLPSATTDESLFGKPRGRTQPPR